jgi:uncharacterized pyridoxamine 5'-phosphate oxidase family protein
MYSILNLINKHTLAALTTVDSHNRPHTVPIHFTCDSSGIYILSKIQTQKIRNINNNKNVGVFFYQNNEYIMIRGTAKILRGDYYQAKLREYIIKYNIVLDDQGRDKKGNPLKNDEINCLIHIWPNKTIKW